MDRRYHEPVHDWSRLGPRARTNDEPNELANKHNDASFDRYSSDVGYGGSGVWYSQADDSGAGLYARPAEADALARLQAEAVRFQRGRHVGRGPKGYRRSDGSIREDVCEYLARDPDIDASDVEVEVREGSVFLTGTVPDRKMKRLAEHVIEQISGIVDIQNWIALKEAKSPSSGIEGASSPR